MADPTELNSQITDLVKPEEEPAEADSAEDPEESEEGV